jgi:hypothetical protein
MVLGEEFQGIYFLLLKHSVFTGLPFFFKQSFFKHGFVIGVPRDGGSGTVGV